MENTGNFEGQNLQNPIKEFGGLNYWVNPNVESVNAEEGNDVGADLGKTEEKQQHTSHFPVGNVSQEESLKNKDMPTYFLEYDLDKLDFMD